MRWWIFFVALAATLITAWLILFADVPLAVLLSLGLGAISLSWLIALLTVPWNLYFAARRVGHEARASREREIEVPAGHEAEAAEIARRMLRVAIGGHVVSAAVIAVITYFSGAQVGYYFAGFYLLATCFRPAGAYFAHLRGRVRTLLEETRYPRQDVAGLTARVDELTETARRLTEEVERLRTELEAARAAAETGDHDLERRITRLTRRFEETVDGLTDNQEIITGLKAFLRLVRGDAGLPPSPLG